MKSLAKQEDVASSRQPTGVISSGVTGTRMTPEINDPEILKYALKGTDEDWANAIKDKDFVGGDGGEIIQVKSSKKASNKRKAGNTNSQDILDSVLKNEKNLKKTRDKNKKAKNSQKKI